MKAKDVVKVFESFEDETEDDELMDLEKVKGVLRSLDDRKDRNLWKTMDGYDEKDYMTFKGSVLEFYLGTKKTATYLLEQLEEFTHDNRDRRMTPQRLFQYQSHFKPIALWLEENNIISTKELDEYFWYGLPKDIRKSIRQDLDMHSKADIPSMKQAFRSARRIVQAMIDEEDDDEEDMEPQVFEDNDDARGIPGDSIDRTTQNIDDMEATETQGLDYEEEDTAEDEDVPERANFLPHVENVPAPIETDLAALQNVPVIESEPPALERRPLAAEDALERNDNDLMMSDDVPAIYDDSPECNKPDNSAAVTDMLASNDDELATNEDVPAVYDGFPQCNTLPIPHEQSPAFEDRPTAIKDVLASDNELATNNDTPVVLEELSVPEDLWNSDNGRGLRLANVFGPTRKIFAYRKVRKKIFYTQTAAQRRTQKFRHYFNHSLPMLPRISLACFLGILFDVWLKERKLESVVGCVLWNREATAIFSKMDGMELETKKTSTRIDDLPIIPAPSIAYGPRHIAEKKYELPSISPTIRRRVSPTANQETRTYDYLPITNSTAFMYDNRSQKTLASTGEHIFWCQEHEQLTKSRISLSIKVKVTSIVTRKLSAPDFAPVNVTYQHQRFSIAMTRLLVLDIGRYDDDRDEEKNGNAGHERLIDRRGNSPDTSAKHICTCKYLWRT